MPRDVLVGLAGPGRLMTVHADDEPLLAILHAPGGTASVFESLTAREREVAALLARGWRNREIADALVISLATVKDHVHKILSKTGLPSRSAVACAWHSARS